MIPMRDGVQLHTVMLVPKGSHHAGILMTRKPYDATALTSHAMSGYIAASLDGVDNAPDVVVYGGVISSVPDGRSWTSFVMGYSVSEPVVIGGSCIVKKI